MTLKGIDVSHWQHPLGVDYSLLYNEGVRFAFIRSAYGTLDDNAFFGHVARALANKIAVGAYSFMHARHDITTQAKKCAQLYEYMPLGCVLDVEQDGITAPMVDLWVKVFFQMVGAYPIIYTSHAMWQKCYGKQPNPHAQNCPLWVAHYTRPNQEVILPNGWLEYVFHQYTDRWVTLAYKEPLDFNNFNGDEGKLNELIKYRVGRKGSLPVVTPITNSGVRAADASKIPVQFDAQEKKR